MQFLLKLKAWQLFLLLVSTLLLGALPVIGFVFSVICVCCYVGWIYATGINMNKIIPEHVRPGAKCFKWCCWFVLIVWVFQGATSLALINFGVWNDFFSNIIELPLILCFMACYIYICSFTARMLESAIEGEVVGFLGALQAFAFVWVLPFGIWKLQPAVQRVLVKYNQK